MKKFLSNRALLNIVIHVAGWSAYVVLLFLIINQDFRTPFEMSLKNNPYWVTTQISQVVYLIALFYLNTNLLIPRLLANKRILYYALAIIGLLAIYLFIPEYIFRNYIPPRPRNNPNPGAAAVVRHHIRIFPMFGQAALFLLIFVISSGAKIVQQWFAAEHSKEKAEKEKLRTELSLLKSQVNPHFLFNTLNNIYAMAITGSEHTADAVMKLSLIMRYILQEAEHELVPLQKDLEFLQRYIELQQFRLSEKADISYQVNGSPSTLRIAPLLLIPFIENAFKYGISAREKSMIHMVIHIQDNVVSLWVENSKHSGNTAQAMETTGIGISNVRRRLDLLYPGKHELIIKDTPSLFSVTLKITCG